MQKTCVDFNIPYIFLRPDYKIFILIFTKIENGVFFYKLFSKENCWIGYRNKKIVETWINLQYLKKASNEDILWWL